MSLGTSASAVSAAPNLRKRRNGRSYAINSFIKGLTGPSHIRLFRIHEIVCYNIWVDLIGFHISNATEDLFFNSPRYPYFASRMKTGLAGEVLRIYEHLHDALYDPKAKAHIMAFVETMTYEDSVAYLDTSGSARFYKHIMNNQICFVKDMRQLGQRTEEGSRVARSCLTSHMAKSLGLSPSPSDMKPIYNHCISLNEDRLVFLLKTLRELRASIAIAAPAGHIHDDLLETLRLRLREFDQRGLYSLACSTVPWAIPEESVYVADSDTWWAASSDSKHDDAGSDKVAYAYASGGKTRSSLAFIVPIIMLISIVPAALAWKRDEFVTGTTGDSNFWQAISNSTLQLLSLVLFIWSAAKDPRLSNITRIWIVALAVLGAICTILNVLVYLVAPMIWSFSISFAGMLVQSVVQLQIITAT